METKHDLEAGNHLDAMSSFHHQTPLKGKGPLKKKPILPEPELSDVDAEEVLKMYSNSLEQCRESN